MFGKIVTAEEWNAALATEHGTEIYDSLRLFHEAPIDLRSPAADLAERLVPALAAIGVECAGVAPVSLGALLAPTRDVPESIASYLRYDVGQCLRRCWKDDFDDHLHYNGLWTEFSKGLGDRDREPVDRAIRLLSDGICHPSHERLAKAYDGVFITTQEAMPFELLAVLFKQTMLFARGRGADARKYAAFASIFLDGNFPLGMARDGTYGVLVA
jgi:hypothetical protein